MKNKTKYDNFYFCRSGEIMYRVWNREYSLIKVLWTPYRLCPHVVVVVELDRFSDIWGYASRATHACQAQNDIPDQGDTEIYAVHRWSRFISETCLLIRRDCASESRTA